MTKPPRENLDPIDPQFEDFVERAMRECGWLLPTTIADVRRAESELKANPVRLPDRLRDPFHVLAGRTGAESKPIAPKTAPPPDQDLWQTIPNALRQLAIEVGLSIDQSLKLLKMGRQVVAHRSSTKKDEMDSGDWRRFYEAVKEFL